MNTKLITLFTLIHFSCYSLPIKPNLVKNIYEYSRSNTPTNSIHTVNIKSSWCGNILLSTLVGNYSEDGICIYKLETPQQGVDECGEYYLNGSALEEIVGLGYTCAATHAHSNVTGHDGYNYYKLSTDAKKHYVGTEPIYGEIDL